jgi:hypothetical protein
MEELSTNPVLGQPSASGVARQGPKSSDVVIGRRFTVKTGSAGTPEALDQMPPTAQSSDQARIKASIVAKQTLALRTGMVAEEGYSAGEQHPTSLDPHHVEIEQKQGTSEQVERAVPETIRPKAPEEVSEAESFAGPSGGLDIMDWASGASAWEEGPSNDGSGEPTSVQEEDRSASVPEEGEKLKEEVSLPEEEEAELKALAAARKEKKEVQEEAREATEGIRQATKSGEKNLDESLPELFSQEAMEEIITNAERLGLNKEEITHRVISVAQYIQDRCGPSVSDEEKTTIVAQRLMEEKEKLSAEAYKLISGIIARKFSIDLTSIERMQEKLKIAQEKKESGNPMSPEQLASGKRLSKPSEAESRVSNEKRTITKDLEERQIRKDEEERLRANAELKKQQKSSRELDKAQEKMTEKQKKTKERAREIRKEEIKEETQREDESHISSSS